MSKRISKEELSDQQIQDIIEEFSNLTEEQRQQRLVGKGAYKTAYDIPGTDYVLKKPHGTKEAINDMAREYAINKRFRDKIDLETPILVSRKTPDQVEPFHIQRKIIPLESKINESLKSFEQSPEAKSISDRIKGLQEAQDELWNLRTKAIDSGDLDDAKEYGNQWRKAMDDRDKLKNTLANLKNQNVISPSTKLIDELNSKLELAGLSGADIHEGNVTPEGKVFDLGSWTGYNYAQDAKNKPLIEMRKAVVDRTISNPKFLGKYGIYRSLAAPLLKTAGKIGIPLAAAASNYAEAKEEGLPPAIAAAYAGAEELNPLPISGIDYYKGMEKAAQGRRKNLESMYMPEEMKAELEAKEEYSDSPAAKDRAYSQLRDLLKTEDNKELVDQLLKKKSK